MEFIRNEQFVRQKCRLRWDPNKHFWEPTTMPCEFPERMRVIARACAFNQANFDFTMLWSDVRRLPLVLVPYGPNQPYRHW